MIKEISKNDLGECSKVIRESFKTVANEFLISQKRMLRDMLLLLQQKKN